MILDAKGNEIKISAKKESEMSDWMAILILSVFLGLAGVAGGFINENWGYIFPDKSPPQLDDNTYSWAFSGSTSNALVIYNSEDPRTRIANGDCVDIASSIIFMLKRNYTAMDRVEVAVSQDHCQVVLDTLGEKTFLAIEDSHFVYESDPEFSNLDGLLFVPYQDFLAAVEYFRPDLTKDELLAYMAQKKTVEVSLNMEGTGVNQ